MPETPRIDTPRVMITYADGHTDDVQSENPDMVFYDLERGKRKWPTLTEAPMLWVNYLAYSKLRRTGVIDRALSFDDWLMSTVSIQNLDDDGQPSQETASVGPTLPDHVSG